MYVGCMYVCTYIKGLARQFGTHYFYPSSQAPFGWVGELAFGNDVMALSILDVAKLKISNCLIVRITLGAWAAWALESYHVCVLVRVQPEIRVNNDTFAKQTSQSRQTDLGMASPHGPPLSLHRSH